MNRCEGASNGEGYHYRGRLGEAVFQVHGACADGSVAFRKKISGAKFLPFLASQPKCVVAMEACAGAHGWARDIQTQGHEVRLIAPVYVKPFVKRQKNDMADAEAITETAARPTMRFVAVKSAEKQASGMIFKTRDLLEEDGVGEPAHRMAP